jgi:type IV secretory pathway VirB2 component (pilin)
MNPFGTRVRSEELARLLDGAVVLGSALAAPTAQYAAVAGRLRSLGTDLAPAVTPRAEFRAALRTRLVAVASVRSADVAAPVTAKNRTLESAVSWTQTRRAQRGIGLAAGAMASVVAVAGIAVAGSQSLPGDPFYGVKRGGEALELRTAGGDVAKGSKHLEFAAERLKEVRELSLGRDAAFTGSLDQPVASAAFGGSVSKRVRGALTDMDRETRTGSDLLTSAYRDSNSDAPLEILSRFAGRQTRDLTALLPDLPAGARPQAESSLALVSRVAVESSQLLAVGVCTGQCAPAQAAPSLPPTTGPMPQPAPNASTEAPCGCQPAPAPARTSDPTPAPTPDPTPEPTTAPSPSPSRPTPSPSPSSPLPVPTEVPSEVPTAVPSLPVPVPTLTPLPAVDVSLPPLPLG